MLPVPISENPKAALNRLSFRLQGDGVLVTPALAQIARYRLPIADNDGVLEAPNGWCHTPGQGSAGPSAQTQRWCFIPAFE